MTNGHGKLDALEPFVGTWRLTAEFEGVPTPEGDSGARVWFEWLDGQRFLIQRWTIPVPDAPDGIAVIGADPERDGFYLQHYFDTRGIARVYRMSFADGVWTLSREEADVSPLHFRQRYKGTFSTDRRSIDGAWEIDEGEGWRQDFRLTYERI